LFGFVEVEGLEKMIGGMDEVFNPSFFMSLFRDSSWHLRTSPKGFGLWRGG